ncbi:RBBP8 N-terminal-like protein [Ochotona curzoniae]|uniref:RBBP8 N-terminal-like protein n=1 Tax=Ochotona curzoniae TaxID=130825 RepID=UPI001B34CB0A|nr:RBBP8 N-terminal-like protein [Ochotona curzoniae]
MESFAEALNRLKDAHDKEVLGLQSKLTELNAERCRDAQRIEELFAKNQQLREQQRLLKENLQVLENRLRAGLCDRCVVTQELARKKQLEMETSHLQGLQHLFLLTNEMKALKQENQALKAAMRRLCGLTARPKPTPQEASPDPPSPLLLPSPGDWKAGPKKLPGSHREAEEEPPGMDTQEGKPVCGSPPGTKASPGTHLPEPRAPDMSPHCISNQLHGTIATVRPGARICPNDHSSADLTSPPSPASEQSLLQPPSAATFEALKRSLQADHLCLLSRHLSLHLQTPSGGPLVPITTQGGSQPQDLKATGAEAWEEPTGVLGLPGTLVGMQDPRLEGALHLLLAQQQLRAQVGSARLQGPALPRQTPPSSPLGSDSRGPKSEGVLPGERQSQPRGPGSPRKESTLQDCGPDKPLDLSDRGRNGQQSSRRPSPEPLPGAGVHSPGTLNSDLRGTRALKLEQPPPPTPAQLSGVRHLLPLGSKVSSSVCHMQAKQLLVSPHPNHGSTGPALNSAPRSPSTCAAHPATRLGR